MNGVAQSPIAIIGLGCLFPKAADAGQFWSNILGRVDAITEVPPSHWRTEDYFDPDPKKPDHTYARRGGFLSTVDFPALEFGITPNTLDGIDTTQLLGLMTAKQALDDAGYGPGRNFDRSKVSVILGVTGTQELVIPLGARLGHPIWRRALKEAGVAEDVANDVVARIADGYVGWQEDSFPGLLGNVVAGRIANRLDLGGTNCVVDAACASSLSAVHLAIYELATGRADMVLTGGMDTFNDIFMYMCFSKTPALSPSGDARPFDAGGDGTILGEGLGCLVLKRLADAERDGDKIYAVIKGLGTSSDGKGHAIYAPSPAGQARALRQAYRLAEVTPDTIDLVEAHGTGTKAGDAAEVEALADVYRSAKAEGRWCALGSVKSQVGHTKAAAGSAGLIKAALALHHKVLPPTIKVDRPIEPLASGESPFYVNAEARPWLPRAANPRRAAVSSFGFGGSNFHCVLEEYRPEKPAIDWDGNVQLLAFSGADEGELIAAVETFPASASWDVIRAEAAHTRTAFRANDPLRLLIVLERDKSDPAKVLGGIRGLLSKFAGRSTWSTPDGAYFGKGAKAGSLAMIFSGQGSQYTGMFRDLACRFPQMQQALAEADESFAADKSARRLSDRIYPPAAFSDAEKARNDEALRRTDAAQPALGAVEIGALRVLQYFGIQPDVVAGHSYGELPALCAAMRFDFGTLCRLSQLRGRLMAEGGDRGAMLAVQTSHDIVEGLIRDEGLGLVIANRNGPKQTVLSGAREEVTRAAAACARRKLTAKELPVSAAFHSPFVSELRAPFAAALDEIAFEPAAMPVYCNTTAAAYPDEPAQSRTLLANQLAMGVDFEGEIRNIYRSGVRSFLEVGPAGKLAGLIGTILEGQDHLAVAVDASSGQRGGVADLARTVAQLAAAGHAVGLRNWDAGVNPKNGSVKKPAMTVPLCGANYVKPRAARLPAIDPVPMKEQGDEPRNGHIAVPAANLPVPMPHANGRLTSTPMPPSARDVPSLDHAARLTQENLLALQKLGEQTARLHGQFLENQNRSLEAFRALIDQQHQLLHGSNGTMPSAPSPTWTTQPAVTSQNGRHAAPTSQPSRPEAIALAPPPPPVPPASPGPSDRISAILVEIISEKTGYPAELLGLDMELDADLGIDSIKRVEIFMLVQEKLPEAPAIQSEHVGSLRTLRDVALFLGGQAVPESASGERQSPDGQESGGNVHVHGDSPSLGGLTPTARRPNSSAVLLEIVSEKTGYPVELLGLDMELDADLGIDSIKRVEIFMLVQEKLPHAPAIKSEHVGSLRTLRDVAAFLDATPVGPTPSASPSERNVAHGSPLPPVLRGERGGGEGGGAPGKGDIPLQASPSPHTPPPPPPRDRGERGAARASGDTIWNAPR